MGQTEPNFVELQVQVSNQSKQNSMTDKNDNNFDSSLNSRIQRVLRSVLVNIVILPSTAIHYLGRGFLYVCVFVRSPRLFLRLLRLVKHAIVIRWLETRLWYYKRLNKNFEQEKVKLKKISSMDEPLPEDIADVLEISAILEIREYDLFGLAYYWWFGRPSPEPVLESHFAKYMFNQVVPLWVRQYSRMVLELQEKGSLDREALGVDRLPDATPESVRAGVRYAVILVTTLCLLVLIAEFAFKYLKLPCFFPPCY